MKKQRVLAVIPAFNEEASVSAVISEFREYLPEADVLVVDDGSADATSRAARSAGARVLRLPYNQGIAGARHAGYEYARRSGYDVLLQLDGDGQHDPLQCEKILAPVVRGEADISIGSRFFDGDSGGSTTVPRRFGIVFLTGFMFMLTGKRVLDPTSGFRAANRKVIELLARNYPYEYPEVEEIVILLKAGCRVSEVPVTMRKRRRGHSFATPLTAVYYMLEVTLAAFAAFYRKAMKG